MNPEMKISGANKTRAYNAMPTHLMKSNGVEEKNNVVGPCLEIKGILSDEALKEFPKKLGHLI